MHNGRLDHLAGNALGNALFSPILAMAGAPPNSARFTFLDPQAPVFLRDWDKAATDTVAILRAEVGRDPYDRALSDLVGELSTRSDEFRGRGPPTTSASTPPASNGCTIRWSATSTSPTSLSRFPDHGQSLLVYVAEPGSPSQDALSMLASFVATQPPDRTAPSVDPVPGVPSAEGTA